jgi:hypothetical protein
MTDVNLLPGGHHKHRGRHVVKASNVETIEVRDRLQYFAWIFTGNPGLILTYVGATQESGFGIGAKVLYGERQVVMKTVNEVFDWEKVLFEDHGVKKVPLSLSYYFLATMFSNKVPGCEDIKSISVLTIRDLLTWKPEFHRGFGLPMLTSFSKFMNHWEVRMPRCTIYGHLPEVTTFQDGVQFIATNFQCCEDGCPEIGTEIRGFGQKSFAMPGQRVTHNEFYVVCQKHKQLDEYEEHEPIGEAHKAVLDEQGLMTEIDDLRQELGTVEEEKRAVGSELEREKFEKLEKERGVSALKTRLNFMREEQDGLLGQLEAMKKDHTDQLDAVKMDHADQSDQLHRFYT